MNGQQTFMNLTNRSGVNRMVKPRNKGPGNSIENVSRSFIAALETAGGKGYGTCILPQETPWERSSWELDEITVRSRMK